MNILDAMLGAAGGAPVRQIGARFGLGPTSDLAIRPLCRISQRVCNGHRQRGRARWADGRAFGWRPRAVLDDPSSLTREPSGSLTVPGFCATFSEERAFACRSRPAPRQTGIDPAILSNLARSWPWRWAACSSPANRPAAACCRSADGRDRIALDAVAADRRGPRRFDHGRRARHVRPSISLAHRARPCVCTRCAR